MTKWGPGVDYIHNPRTAPDLMTKSGQATATTFPSPSTPWSLGSAQTPAYTTILEEIPLTVPIEGGQIGHYPSKSDSSRG